MAEPHVWELKNAATGASMTISLTYDDVTLTVTLAQKDGSARTDEKKLKSYDGALKYVQQFILEREVRGFKLVRDSLAEKWAAEWKAKQEAEAAAAAAAAALLPPGGADVVTAACVKRDGWLALSCEKKIGQALMDALLSDRIDTLQLVCDVGDDDDDNDQHYSASKCLQLVAGSARPAALRTLILDTHWQTIVRQTDPDAGNRWGDLGAAVNALTGLEHVYVAGLFSSRTPFAHARLRNLTLASSDMHAAMVALRKAELPALTDLGVAGSGEADVDDDAIAALLDLLRDADALPALTSLDVDGFGDPVAILEALAQRKPASASALASVRIAGELGDEDVVLPRLLALAPAFAKVDVHIALDTLSEEALATVQAAWPSLVDDENHRLFLPERYRSFAADPPASS